MTLWQAVLLGVIQGLTEFLPISSSGHLVISRELFGLSEPVVLFDVLLHVATLIAVVGYFFAQIRKLNAQATLLIGIASIPAVVVGAALQLVVDQLFDSLLLVAVGLLVTGVFVLISDRLLGARKKPSPDRPVEVISTRQALVIGLFQALAIVPGISRSGSTICAGLIQKLPRRLAFKFSFLMSIPVILGAAALQLNEVAQGGTAMVGISPLAMILGAVAAALVGWLSLKLLDLMIETARLEYFAGYCFILSGLLFSSMVI